MTPPIFNLDDEVEIIGRGRRFKISQLQRNCDGSTSYSYGGLPWYPASSLRLVEELHIGDYAEVVLTGSSFTGKIGQVTDDSGLETVVLYNVGVWDRRNLRKLSEEEVKEHVALKIGDEVEITGPCKHGYRGGVGERFVITKARDCMFSANGQCWLPASSLRLVEEELKIGDWVEVIGPYDPIFSPVPGAPSIFQIDAIFNAGKWYRSDYEGDVCYPAKSLRKLTPEEISQHQKGQIKVSVNLDCSEFAAGLEKCQDKLWKIGIEARLSTIEAQQKEMWDRMDINRELRDTMQESMCRMKKAFREAGQ